MTPWGKCSAVAAPPLAERSSSGAGSKGTSGRGPVVIIQEHEAD